MKHVACQLAFPFSSPLPKASDAWVYSGTVHCTLPGVVVEMQKTLFYCAKEVLPLMKVKEQKDV